MDSAIIVYLSIFSVGFVFLITSFLFGFGHFDMEHHAEIGHSADNTDNTISPSFFSAKVIACFLVGFGMGAIVSHSWLTTVIKIETFKFFVDGVIGFIFGLVIAFCAWSIIKFFMSQQASSLFSNEKFVGLKVPLRVGIPQHGTGEITAEIGGQVRSLDVQSENGCQIVTGTNVEIIKISGNIGIVKVL